MTTIADHIALLTARRDWLRAKQDAYNTERARLTARLGVAYLREVASALVPLARELRSAAERIYLALVPALYAANRPEVGTRPPDVEALRRLCEEGVRMWATAQATLQEYAGTAGQPGPMQMAPMRVPAWEAYVIGPTGLVGLQREIASTTSASLDWLDEVVQGTEYQQAQRDDAERQLRERREQQQREVATATAQKQTVHGVLLGVVILGALWYGKKWYEDKTWRDQ